MIDITPADQEIVTAILKKYVPHTEVRVFGSRHKWTAKPYSDLDLAIVADAKLDKQLIYDLEEAFEESELSFRVDVIDWYAISDEFRTIIEQGYTVIQEKTRTFPAGWVVKKLGDVVDCYDKLRIPLSSIQRSKRKGVFAYYGAQGIIDYVDSYIFDGRYILVAEDGENLRSRKQPIANIANGKFWVNNHAHVLTNNQNSDFNFIFYYLNFVNISPFITGAAQPKLNQENLFKIPVLLPPLEEQKEIAAILSSLDDKIELNQQINKKLEEIAQAIFKEWFIDFNFPDEHGNPYRDSGGAMIDSELGPIPASWSIGKLGDYIILNKGKSYKSSELIDNGLPMINLKTFGRNGNFRHDGIKYFDGQYKESHIVKSGDLVISMTDVTQQAEIIGNPLIIPTYLKKAIISLDVVNIIPVNFLSRAYLYFLIKNRHFKEFIKGFSSGTTVLHLNKDGILNYKFALPPKKVLEEIDHVFNNILRLININDETSITTEHVRNILLPKLVSKGVMN